LFASKLIDGFRALRMLRTLSLSNLLRAPEGTAEYLSQTKYEEPMTNSQILTTKY
jgi:hypothetical protein